MPGSAEIRGMNQLQVQEGPELVRRLSFLIARENPKVVSERLGHASVTITLDTYSHVLPTMQKAAAEKLDKLFG
jgi:integrase